MKRTTILSLLLPLVLEVFSQSGYKNIPVSSLADNSQIIYLPGYKVPVAGSEKFTSTVKQWKDSIQKPEFNDGYDDLSFNTISDADFEVYHINTKLDIPDPRKTFLSEWKWLRTGGSFALGVFGGYGWGVHEGSRYWYNDFKAKHPDADDQWWNSEISHTNKYKNHDPKQGEAFLGSTSVFVWTTDANHFYTTWARWGSMMSIGVNLIGPKPTWQEIVGNVIAGAIGYGIGFELGKAWAIK